MRVSSLGSPSQVILLLSLTSLLIGCGDDTGKPSVRHPQDFLPQVLGGMSPEGAPTIATTADELREAINGDYFIYTDHSFQELVQQFYVGTIGESQAHIEVWIFEMPDAQEARELYEDDRMICTAPLEELNDIGEQGALCPGFVSQLIRFQREKYWCRVLIDQYADNAGEDARTVAELFAAHIDQKIME